MEKSAAKTHHTSEANFYPKLVFKNNEHPDSLFAFPLVGFLIKLIMLIPVGIFMVLIGIVYAFLWFITPFVILFTGKYWDTAYEFAVNYMTYKTKIFLFLSGLTDKYPGFSLDANGLFELELPKPTKPNRWLALPLFGFIIRVILLIPYNIYQSVLMYGMYASVIASWFGVLIKGKYPESLYEFNHDAWRVSLASTVYLSYLSDTYPSFTISMKHKNTKIALIVIGAILFLLASMGDWNNNQKQMKYMQQQHSSESQPMYKAPVGY
jgi:hypothetical protein